MQKNLLIFYLSQTLKMFLFQRFGLNMLYQRLIRQSTITCDRQKILTPRLYQRLIRQSTITFMWIATHCSWLYQRLIRQSTITNKS